MTIRQRLLKLVMVGAFPPPVHGMAAVNLAVSKELRKLGIQPIIINLSAASLNRSVFARAKRLPKVLSGFARFLWIYGLRGQPCYLSVSGGFGQVYELLFILIARIRDMRIYLHHHSFSYIDKRSFGGHGYPRCWW